MIIVIVSAILYIFFLIISLITWIRIKNIDVTKDIDNLPFVSIVVACRDDYHKLDNLICSMELLQYPHHLFEIIVVDDHSAKIYYYEKKNIEIKQLKNSGIGKKAAIYTGIMASKADIIVCTDADCEVQSTWLLHYAKIFENNDINLAFGAVMYSGTHLFEKMQQIEFASLVGSAAVTHKWGLPTMCNAANVAYRKNAYLSVINDLPNDLPSGDDEFLMHQLYKNNPKSVVYIKSNTHVVCTRACRNIIELYHQRMRWASKWEHYTLSHVQWIALFVLFSNISYIVIGVISLFEIYYLVYILIRAILEYVFLRKVMVLGGQRINLLAFLILQLVYPYYVIFFAIAGRFKKFNWKNRNLHSR
ncbi:MAG: glycosyltransferase [Cytophagales bacterium]|nr:glycosyltransferase [Cytophagales bacterium]